MDAQFLAASANTLDSQSGDGTRWLQVLRKKRNSSLLRRGCRMEAQSLRSHAFIEERVFGFRIAFAELFERFLNRELGGSVMANLQFGEQAKPAKYTIRQQTTGLRLLSL
jgi:hypothetical protein